MQTRPGLGTGAPRRAQLAVVAAALLLARAQPAEAAWWTVAETEEHTLPRVHIGPALSFWTGTFERTENACRGGSVLTPPNSEALFGGCAGPSNEIGFAFGAAVTVRVWGPIHLAAELDLVSTIPERDYDLLSQVIIALPMSLLLTFPEWRFRPVARLTVLPFVSVRDLGRDFTVGGEGGLATEVPGLGTLEISGGYQTAEKTQIGLVRLALLFGA